jgi:hypothetical protein
MDFCGLGNTEKRKPYKSIFVANVLQKLNNYFTTIAALIQIRRHAFQNIDWHCSKSRKILSLKMKGRK